MPDLLTHAFVAYTICTLLSWRYAWLTPTYDPRRGHPVRAVVRSPAEAGVQFGDPHSHPINRCRP
jgi:hypothetical protein